MPKIPIVDETEATDEQRRVGAPIFAERGTGYSGPYGILLHYPELTEKAGAFGSFVRAGATLPKRLSELVIAVTARNWMAQFEWSAHHHQALAAGLAPDVLDAIRTGRRPVFANEDEEVVYDYATQIYANNGIDDDLHARAVALFGVKGVIAIVSIAGYYTYLAFVCNAFDLEVTRPDPPPLQG